MLGLLRRAAAGVVVELARTLKTKSSAKKRFRINGAGILTFRRTGKHHKMVKRTASGAARLGLAGAFSQTVSRRLRGLYFPGW
jgi:ribosomal protein L35